jgi:hypothetical protein
MGKISIISAFLLLFAAVNASAVDRDWTNTEGDRLWRNPANWSGGEVPTSADKAAIRNQAIVGPIIDSDTTAAANFVVLGDWQSSSDTVTMTGGSLITANWFSIGYYIQNNGTFTISDGTVNIGTYMYVGNGGTGTVTISGGSITVNGLLSVAHQEGSTGKINLNGGTISAGTLNINSGGKISITTGTLIVDGNQITSVSSYEASGLLTAYNGGGHLIYDYNTANPGKTTVTAVSSGTVSWDNGAGDNLWTTPDNWSSNTLPDMTIGILVNTSGASPIINPPMEAAGFQIRVGATGGANLTMNGGTLDAGEWLMIGTEQADRSGTFTMNGGMINLGCFNSGSGHLWIGQTGHGTFIMNGGTINAPGKFGLGWTGGAADVHLDGGTVTAGSLSISSLCHLDITGGTLVISGDQTAAINSYKDSGRITAFGGRGKLLCEYNVANPGKTTITAKAPVAGDMDKDDDVDADDLILFANEWLGADTASAANFDATGNVDFKDFSILAANWMDQVISKWHVVATQYPTDDFVISPYRAPDFGIVGDGVTDVTTAIQTAMNSISALGGGTLFLPSGNYKVSGNLTIPGGVCLRGEWVKPQIGIPITGTILQAYAGRGDANGTPFIGISRCSGVKGIAIWYPEQDASDIRPYPPTFQRISGNSQTFENITFVNSYIGFTTYNNSITGSPFLRNIYGSPLKTGIEFDCLAEVGRIETVHFSPDYWRYSGLPNSPTANEHAQWIYDNGTGIIVRRIDWSYAAYVTIEGYNIGLAMRPSLYDGHPPNGQCYAFTISNCRTGVYFENCALYGMLLSRFDIQGAQIGVHFDTAATGPAMLHTFAINASEETVLSRGSGAVMMQNCQFGNKVEAENGYLTIVNSDFAATTNVDIELGSNVKGASIAGNRFENGAQISNNTSYPVYIDHAPQNVAALPDYNYKKPERDFKPAKSSLYVVTKYPYNATGDGTNDDSAAFETALADAGANGGGTVFVPGGDYKLTRNLIIPAGVELRGIFEVPHLTAARGSVLNIYTGRGQENGTPFIQIQTGGGIRGLTFHYPEQIYDANDRVGYGFVPYPFLIRGLGANVYIINVSATIPYQFIDLDTFRCDNHYVDYVWSTALKTGVKVGGGCVGGQLQNCQFNPSSYSHSWAYYPSISPNAEGDVRQYLWDNARTYIFGNMTGEVLHQNFVFGAYNGIYFISENGIGPSGYCLGFGADQSTTSLRLDAIGPAGLDMINTQLVTVDTARGRYVEMGNSLIGTARLFNAACWGNTNRAVVVNGGRLDLQLFHIVKAGTAAYDLHGSGIFTCIGGDVLNAVDTVLLIDPTANATFVSNIFNTPDAQMPVNSSNTTSLGNLRYQ